MKKSLLSAITLFCLSVIPFGVGASVPVQVTQQKVIVQDQNKLAHYHGGGYHSRGYYYYSPYHYRTYYNDGYGYYGNYYYRGYPYHHHGHHYHHGHHGHHGHHRH